MSLNDVELVKLRLPDRVTGLKAGTIDAAIIGEPFVAKAKDLGIVRELISAGEALGEAQEAILLSTDKVINEKRPAMELFMKAYKQGIADYFANPQKPEYLKAVAKIHQATRGYHCQV